jgi:hypothetical protein
MAADTKKPVKFFVPEATPHEAEGVYALARAALTDQLRWPITDRRVFRLDYVHDKKSRSVEVGGLEAQSRRFIILAIFESSVYIVHTRAVNGGAGVTILVSKDEVTEVTDFA